MTGERLGRWLLEHGRITSAQLDEARRTRAFFGGDLGTHLVKLGYLTEAAIGAALAEMTGVPCADDRLRRIAPEVAARVPAEIAARYRLCAFELDGRTLRVAMRNPRDAVAIAAVREATRLDPEPWVASDLRLAAALSRHHGVEPDGISGVAVHPSQARSPEAFGDPPAETALDPDGGEDAAIGLDGLPLDAVLGFDDPSFFRGGGAPSGGVPAESDDDDPEDSDAERPEPPSDGPGIGAPAGRPPDPLASLEERLALAVDRDDVAFALLEFCRQRSARCALFALTREGLRCVAGRGRGLNTERLKRIRIPVDGGTIFQTALAAEAFYLGPVPPLPANKDVYSLLGGRLPPNVLTVPIRLRGRVVALLYLDHDAEPIVSPDIPLMRRIAAKAGLAFEILLLRGKLREV